MADSMGRKLVVEVCNAKNLMPKDGQGTASAFVMVDFDGQRRRTRTISRDLNPEWNEKLEFIVHDPESMANEVLELNIYNDKKTGKRSNFGFLGKVKISGLGFPKSSSDDLVYYPLEKRNVFSQIKGEIGLKIWYDDPPAPPAIPTATEEQPPEATPEEKEVEKKEEEKKAEEAVEEEKKEEEKKSEDPKPEEDPNPNSMPATEHPKPEEPVVVEANANTSVSEAEKPTDEKSKQLATIKQSEPQSTSARHNLEVRSLACPDRGPAIGYELVDRMPFLYVRVVKAKCANPNSDSSVFAKLVIGTHSIETKTQVYDKDWDQVFTFDKEGLNSSSLEVSVWTQKKVEEDKVEEGCLGKVSFDLQEVPKRVPPDSPLAPQWYSLEGSEGNDVMVAVWVGTQADEAFQEAWQSDSGGLIPETRAKVYLSPKLWYLRLTIIQTQDLQLSLGSDPKARAPELYIRGQLGDQVFKTSSRIVLGSTNATSSSPTWNEDLIFVAAEPFEPFLVATVEDVTDGRSVGCAKIHVASIERRSDDRVQPKSKWYNLAGQDESKQPYAGRIHVRTCLEGGYHVLDEAAHVTSDVQPSAKQLAKGPIGLLEVGIRGANNLLPIKTKDGTRGTIDAYVVAKYGPKWVRTRTILDRFNPRWNEQYTWEVHDPCTVLSIGVFDNGRYKKGDLGKPGKDIRIGKLRIRLSTLDTNRIYLNTYPLTVLLPVGARRMGEIEIAVRFTCSSWINLLQAYSSPTLPRMHYVCPLGRAQQDILRHTAMRIVTTRLARSEPALGQEVVQYMLDSDIHIWSMRKSKVNWLRVVGGLSKVAAVANWFESIRTWAHPPTTILVHIILVAIVLCPHLVLPTFFMYAFLILAFRIRYRALFNMDPRISCVDVVSNDEVDEEFDGFPTTKPTDVVRMRYDKLRALAGRAQSFLGDMAAQWERMEALCNWRDPRATGIFLVFLLMTSLVFYAVPFKAIVLGVGFYYLRHPKFRDDMPSVPINFFRRLPSLSDQIL